MRFTIYYAKIPAMTQGLIFIFSGESHFMSELYLNRLLSSHSDFPATYLDQCKDPNHIVDHLQQPQLFKGQEFVVCKSAQFLNQSAPEKDFNHFSNAIDHLDGSTKIALVYQGNLDKRKKWSKWIESNANIQHKVSKPFMDWESEKAAKWISDEAIALKLKLPFQSAELLIECCGLEPAILFQRLKSLKDFIGDRQDIKSEDILTLFDENHNSIFKYLDSFKRPKTKDLIKQTNDLIKGGEAPIKIFGLLSNQLRLFLDILILSQTHQTNQIAKILGKNPYFIQRLLQDIQNHHNIQSLQSIIIFMAKIDTESKKGDIDPQIGLELVVQKILKIHK